MKKINWFIQNRLLRVAASLIVFSLALFTLGWLLTIGDYSVPTTVADDPNLPVIVANGYRFHGETFGNPDAPPLIVVHGGPGWDYRSLLPLQALADAFHVIFYDQRGSGLSSRVAAEELSLESALADLDAIVEKYRRGNRVDLVGHSWGAMLVAAYLGRKPDKVDHAVLAEPGFFNTELLERSGLRMGPLWEADYLLFAAIKWFESLHIDSPDDQAAADYFLAEVASRANPEYYCDGVIPAAGTLRWRAGATAMKAVLTSAANTGEALEFDITAGLKHYPRPVLLLASECNHFIGVEQQRRHAKYFNAAELAIIKGSGHMLFAEQPEASLATVRRYLRNH
ncbi:MAG: alpha/beta hydrolase [Pseudomonadota bacterium]